MGIRGTITKHEELRRRSGYNLTKLSRALGFSNAYISKIEGRKIPASARYRQAACTLLKVPEEYLFDQKGRARTLEVQDLEVRKAG